MVAINPDFKKWMETNYVTVKKYKFIIMIVNSRHNNMAKPDILLCNICIMYCLYV